MLVRPATIADARGIALIHVETWRAAYRGQMPDAVLNALDVERRAAFWQERLKQMRGQVFVAETSDRIVGFCDLIPSRDKDAHPETVAEIAAIYVHPEHWHKGSGRTLCHRAFAEAGRQKYNEVTLWVLDSNVTARHFYTAIGFVRDGASKIEKLADGSQLSEIRFRIAIAAPNTWANDSPPSPFFNKPSADSTGGC